MELELGQYRDEKVQTVLFNLMAVRSVATAKAQPPAKVQRAAQVQRQQVPQVHTATSAASAWSWRALGRGERRAVGIAAGNCMVLACGGPRQRSVADSPTGRTVQVSRQKEGKDF